MTPFERGLVAHLVADWLLQNDWMARNKSCLCHPAAWLHSGIHAVLLSWALGWGPGLILAVAHLAVDSRLPLELWRHFFRQTTGDGYNGQTVAVWSDQVVHILLLAIIVLIMEG